MRSDDFFQIDLAVNFHQQLNPRLFDNDKQMHPEVRKALLNIAKHFQNFLGVDNLDLVDITISGSNAAYTYTPHSDLDLHLVVLGVTDDQDHDAHMRQLFDAKKYQYNDQHEISVRDIDVELYVQDADQPHASAGVYSVMKDKWIRLPRRRRADIDDYAVKNKFQNMRNRINQAILSDDFDRIQAVWDDVKNMRKTGLAREGEFSPENLAFKILRAQGMIEKLRTHVLAITSRDLSIDEDEEFGDSNPMFDNGEYIDESMDDVVAGFQPIPVRPKVSQSPAPEPVNERRLGGFDVTPLDIQDQDVDEALKLDAPQKKWSRDELHGYIDRIQTDTKTKADKFKPIIHGSNVKALTKSDNPDDRWDLDDLARQIMTRPSKILGTNAKMAKSKEEGAMTYDLTLPALSGIVMDEETGDFVEITTCPGAGECQLFCYARKGGYRMFPASSMSAAQALNFLVNDPKGYMEMFDREVKMAQSRTSKAGIKLLVRIHDAGDFFSKDYYNLAMDVARNNPDATFYFYTKMGEIATDAGAPPNVIGQFSGGAQKREVKKVEFQRGAGRHVKDAITLPKDMFRDLFQTDAKGKYVKDEKGRTQVKGEAEWNQFKQQLAAEYKIEPDTIITYDQMLRIPEGPKPKWNVVVFPAGHGDLGASRLDVSKQFLMFH